MPVPARIIPTAPARQENSLLAAANLVLGLLIAGCGSDGRAPAAPTQVATPPTPAPPVPPPVVTPPDPAPVPTGPLIAEVAPGGRLEGAHVCAGTRDTFAEGRLVGIEMLGPAILAELASPAFAIDYVNDNSFGTDFNGFGGSSYAPGDRRTAPSRAYAGSYFAVYGVGADQTDEFELYRNSERRLRFATFGRTSNPGTLCFFSAGAVSDTSILADGSYAFAGMADGLLVASGVNRRLFGSTAKAVLDANGKTLLVTIDLVARDQAFGEFLDRPATSVGQVSARFPYSRSALGTVPLSGPDGATGSIRGGFYKGSLGAGFVFALEYPNGDRIFGAAGLDLEY
ncbi:hypothetical protein [Sandaracinobacteroides hominis]|uniref:hypothetical protein n=1 Tax=Sandaracinobacteroides hominis TaxID=2780086 RepID=UPI0018F2F390|nr:hypothetical protein [Sandaracinobacteroides hominis]